MELSQKVHIVSVDGHGFQKEAQNFDIFVAVL